MRRWVTVLSVAVLMLAFLPEGHASTVRWTRHAGTAVFAAAAGPKGVVYATGKRPVGITVEAMLIKYGPNGARLWTRTWLPSQQTSTIGVGVAVAPDGVVYMVGSVQGGCEGGSWFIRAYSPGGALLRVLRAAKSRLLHRRPRPCSASRSTARRSWWQA